MFKDDVDDPTHLRPVRDGFYLDMETRTERRCEKPSIAAAYLKNCGMKGTYHLMSGDSEIIISKDDCDEITRGTCKKVLPDNLKLAHETHDWQYMRGGIVSPCTTCLQNQYMNVPCSSDNAGFAGSCTNCKWCFEYNYYKDRDTDTCRPCELCEY